MSTITTAYTKELTVPDWADSVKSWRDAGYETSTGWVSNDHQGTGFVTGVLDPETGASFHRESATDFGRRTEGVWSRHPTRASEAVAVQPWCVRGIDNNCDSTSFARDNLDDIALAAGTVNYWCNRAAAVPCQIVAGSIEAAATLGHESVVCDRPSPDAVACSDAEAATANWLIGAPGSYVPGPVGFVIDTASTGFGWGLALFGSDDSGGGGTSNQHYCPTNEMGGRC